MPRPLLFEYRAWPDEGMPHIERLHHLFGLGVAEIRTDTYIFSPERPDWMILAHGGTEVEILEKTSAEDPLSAWKVQARSEYPLRRGLVRNLQEAFPQAQLSHRMVVPGDLISWLDRDAAVFAVNKRTVQFQREGCVAEFTQLEADGRRAETFSLTSKRADIIMDALALLPAPRLPNLDYGSWLHQRTWSAPALAPAASAPIRPDLTLPSTRVA